MSLNYGESTNLRNIAADMKKAATSLATLVKILETLNTNLAIIGRDLTPLKAEKHGSYLVVKGDGSVVFTKHPEDLGIDPQELEKP